MARRRTTQDLSFSRQPFRATHTRVRVELFDEMFMVAGEQGDLLSVLTRGGVVGE